MRPLLVVLDDDRQRPSAEIRAALAREFGLTEQDLTERLPSGTQHRFVNVVAWALHHLSRARLVERTRPSTYRITERGHEVLAAHPTSVDIAVCAQFDEYHHSRTRRSSDTRRASRTEGPGHKDADLHEPSAVLTRAEREELVRLRHENAELRRANETLKSASVLFAKELDAAQSRHAHNR
jgi:restriction system protein